MEGINSLCLGGFLCVVVLAVGGVIFVPLLVGAKTIIKEKFGGKNQWIGTVIALIVACIISYVLFYTLYAPTFPDYYTPQRRPDPKDIVGVWVPTADTLERMKKAGYPISKHGLEFRENGDIIMTNMHDIIFWRNKGEYYSGYGKWTVEKNFQGIWVVNVVFSSLTPSYYPDPPLSGPTPCPGSSVPCDGLEFTFYMSNRKPPYTLYADIGIELDPDFYLYRLGDVH
jgi:hypothetical protein